LRSGRTSPHSPFGGVTSTGICEDPMVWGRPGEGYPWGPHGGGMVTRRGTHGDRTVGDAESTCGEPRVWQWSREGVHGERMSGEWPWKGYPWGPLGGGQGQWKGIPGDPMVGAHLVEGYPWGPCGAAHPVKGYPWGPFRGGPSSGRVSALTLWWGTIQWKGIRRDPTVGDRLQSLLLGAVQWERQIGNRGELRWANGHVKGGTFFGGLW
jgi:hypothetical protein